MCMYTYMCISCSIILEIYCVLRYCKENSRYEDNIQCHSVYRIRKIFNSQTIETENSRQTECRTGRIAQGYICYTKRDCLISTLRLTFIIFIHMYYSRFCPRWMITAFSTQVIPIMFYSVRYNYSIYNIT